jgi:hypothetical protein
LQQIDSPAAQEVLEIVQKVQRLKKAFWRRDWWGNYTGLTGEEKRKVERLTKRYLSISSEFEKEVLAWLKSNMSVR